MVHLTKIYTKTGDKGMTSIANNTRIEKISPVIAAIGAVDEANSAIGMCGIHNDTIDQIQNDLFDLGAELAGADTVRITAKKIQWLEKTIDEINEHLEPLHSFVLPTGTLHNARTIVRRAEREVWYIIELQDMLDVKVSELTATYLNRLSDLLFVMARYHNKGSEKLWKPMSKSSI
jgi:cob(I)alamin adenosyltransferase